MLDSTPTNDTNKSNDSNEQQQQQKVCFNNQLFHILLVKNIDENNNNSGDNEYYNEIHAKFIDTNHDISMISPIEFEFCNLDKLHQTLLNSIDQYCGIILTSKRCIDALIKAINYDDNTRSSSIRDSLKSLNIYTVGAVTRAYLMEKLELDSVGYESGNSENLSKFIIDNMRSMTDKSKRLLYPCSRIRTDNLIKMLSENDIPIDEITCYDTIVNRNLKENFEKFLSKLKQSINNAPSLSIILAIIFFSPSGVENLYHYVQQYLLPLSDSINLKFIAFGKQTSSRMASKNLPVWFIVSKPNPKTLAENLYDNFISYEDDNPRVLGLAMVPGQHIVSIHVDEIEPN